MLLLTDNTWHRDGELAVAQASDGQLGGSAVAFQLFDIARECENADHALDSASAVGTAVGNAGVA